MPEALGAGVTFASPILLALLSLAATDARATDAADDPPRAGPSGPVAVEAAVESATPRCALELPASDAMTSERCLTCHGRREGAPDGCMHPVQRSYRQAKGYVSGRLRPEAEVERRGVLLLEGRVECVSCHDGRSRWADHVVQLPGTRAEAPWLPPGMSPAGRSGGAAIDTTPLCSACHDMTEPQQRLAPAYSAPDRLAVPAGRGLRRRAR